MRLSREGQLYLQFAEMQTIQRRFAELGRDPTDVELETIAQTWSEHCSHKTLAGRIAYRDASGERRFENMLKETIFAATRTIREQLGDDDWCVSVFKDNAGVVRFDDENNLAFKVETHNHPSALEPYGGANTGIGGVIRDILGTGLGGDADRLDRRLLLRPARHPRPKRGRKKRPTPRRLAPKTRPPRGRRRRSRLRQSDGHPDGQRRDLFRRTLPWQSACLLRAALGFFQGTSRSASRSRATRSSSLAGGRVATVSTARLSPAPN